MKENIQHFWHIMLYYFKKDKNTTEMQNKKICAVYGEGAVTDQTCQKWFAKFVLEIALWMMLHCQDRPVEVDSNQIQILIENNQRSATQEIADILKTSKSIKLLVKMKMYLSFYRKKMDFWTNPIVVTIILILFHFPIYPL